MTTVGWGEILDGMEIRRAIIRSAIERGIQEIRSDPQRGVRKLVDLGTHFSRGRFQKRIFREMQDELVNPNTAYYAMVTNLVNRVRAGHIERLANAKYPQEYIQKIDAICADKARVAQFYAAHGR